LVCAWLPEGTLSPSKLFLGAAGGKGKSTVGGMLLHLPYSLLPLAPLMLVDDTCVGADRPG